MGPVRFQSSLASIVLVSIYASGMDLAHPARRGADPDFPPFVSEYNGVYEIPWGAGNYTWPEKLFWENKTEIRDKLQVMRQGAQELEQQGRVPIMSTVAWGYEYIAATGGDPNAGISDMSRSEGWQQWGGWLSARKDKYLAQDWDGKIYYPSAGYVTPLMPLDREDWPAGIDSATYGDWVGDKLGRLANEIHSRGFFAADFVVGLYGSNHDFNPRVIDDFENWAKVEVPGATVAERAGVIKARFWTLFNDYRCHRYARFYARAAETIRSSGREPLVGGQILPDVPTVRGTGNDFRIYLKYLPAKDWYFQVELQADEGRPVMPYWSASTFMGVHAARAPDFPLGAHMDGYQTSFWNAVANGNKDSVWARRYMKHAWLSVGWTHVANTDGTVRRAPQAFQRAYWDAGGVDTPVVAMIRRYIPRQPFGPAVYYSTDLERQSESTGNPNFYYWVAPKTLTWRSAGIPLGYFVSDTALAKLKAENRPSGWFVYVDNLDQTRLKPEEKARLEAIAPILTEADYRSHCPLVFEGDSLGGFAFIDQNGSVIVTVSNQSELPVEGALRFARVQDNDYTVKDLFSQKEAPMKVTGNKARFPISMGSRETRVFEIPGLLEVGKTGVGVAKPTRRPPSAGSGIGPHKGTRLDALGRRSELRPSLVWSAPLP